MYAPLIYIAFSSVPQYNITVSRGMLQCIVQYHVINIEYCACLDRIHHYFIEINCKVEILSKRTVPNTLLMFIEDFSYQVNVVRI